MRDSVLILAEEVDDEEEDEMLLPDIDGDNPGTPPPVDPLLITLVVVAVESRLEEVLFIESFDNLLSLDAEERNKSVSSSVIGDGPVGSGGSGPVGGNVGGGFENTEEVEGVEDGWPGIYGDRGEDGMNEGGAGNDSRSSGTMTGGILGGLRADMGREGGGWAEGDELGGKWEMGWVWDWTGGYKLTNRNERDRDSCQTRLPRDRTAVRIQRDLEDGTASDPKAIGRGSWKRGGVGGKTHPCWVGHGYITSTGLIFSSLGIL